MIPFLIKIRNCLFLCTFVLGSSCKDRTSGGVLAESPDDFSFLKELGYEVSRDNNDYNIDDKKHITGYLEMRSQFEKMKSKIIPEARLLRDEYVNTYGQKYTINFEVSYRSFTIQSFGRNLIITFPTEGQFKDKTEAHKKYAEIFIRSLIFCRHLVSRKIFPGEEKNIDPPVSLTIGSLDSLALAPKENFELLIAELDMLIKVASEKNSSLRPIRIDNFSWFTVGNATELILNPGGKNFQKIIEAIKAKNYASIAKFNEIRQ